MVKSPICLLTTTRVVLSMEKFHSHIQFGITNYRIAPNSCGTTFFVDRAGEPLVKLMLRFMKLAHM